MKFKLIFILLFITHCTAYNSNVYQKKMYNSKGFAYIYNANDFENKIVNKKINNYEILISHPIIKRGKMIKLTNPRNGKYLVLKNNYKIKYPEFFKILITEGLAEKLEINKDIPYVEIEEIKKNDLFVAEKAEIFDEEKQISDKAPIEKVSVSNLNKIVSVKKKGTPKFKLILSNFYTLEAAKLFTKRIIFESNYFNDKKISIFKQDKHNYEVFLGPYKSINMIRNDYTRLKKIEIEEIDVKILD